MAGRYIVTGTQLGLIKGYAEAGRTKEVLKLVDEIVDKQFIGNTTHNVEKDIQRYLIENVATNPSLHIKKDKCNCKSKKYFDGIKLHTPECNTQRDDNE